MHSPKGWTNQELGTLWLQLDFERLTCSKCGPNEYRLLILDGHNSHTTYKFCDFAQKHNIIVLCLPPHTTHHLQPCDVGAFGPLEATWKAEVNKCGITTPIRKHNFVRHYHNARTKAFSSTTILSSWRKTGIHPLNTTVISDDDYAPALNTTTQAAQPISTTLPTLLEPVTPPSQHLRSPSCITVASMPSLSSSGTTALSRATPTRATPQLPTYRSLSLIHDITPLQPSHTCSPTTTSSPTGPGTSRLSTALSCLSSGSLLDNDVFARMSAEQVYRISGLPDRASARASKETVLAENAALRKIIERCCYQMQRDHAVKKLMEKENEDLRQQLFGRANKPKKKQVNNLARHMTAEENLQTLAIEDWKSSMKLVFASEEFKNQKKRLEAELKRLQDEAREVEKEAERERKEEEKREKAQQKEAEKQEKAEKRRLDREEKARLKKLANEEKALARAEEAAEAARKKDDAELKAAAAEQKKAQTAKRRAESEQKRYQEEMEEMERRKVRSAADTSRMLSGLATPRARAMSKKILPKDTSPQATSRSILAPSSAQDPRAPCTPSRPPPRPRPVRKTANLAGPDDLDSMFILRRSSRFRND